MLEEFCSFSRHVGEQWGVVISQVTTAALPSRWWRWKRPRWLWTCIGNLVCARAYKTPAVDLILHPPSHPVMVYHPYFKGVRWFDQSSTIAVNGVRTWTQVCPTLFITPWKEKLLFSLEYIISHQPAEHSRIRFKFTPQPRQPVSIEFSSIASLFEQLEAWCCPMHCAEARRPPLGLFLWSRQAGALDSLRLRCYAGSRWARFGWGH